MAVLANLFEHDDFGARYNRAWKIGEDGATHDERARTRMRQDEFYLPWSIQLVDNDSRSSQS